MRTTITTFSVRETPHTRRVIRTIVGLLVCFIGAQDMISALLPRHGWLLILQAWPGLHQLHAQTFTVVVGFFLIMLSYGLMRGKRHAWCITIILLLLSSLLHIMRSGAIIAALIALACALLLCGLVRFFQARSDPPSVRRGYIVLILGMGIVISYTVGGLIVWVHDFEPWIERIGFVHAMMRTLTAGSMRFMHTSSILFFTRILPLLCTSAIIYGMVSIFRPVTAKLLTNHSERGLVRELVQRYGSNSISYFALGSDKVYFFSENRQSVISYVLHGSTAVVAGDPIGPACEQFKTIQQFLTFCLEQDWTIAFWQTSDSSAELYRKAGLHLIKIGEDAVLDLPQFTLKGGTMANVRSSAKRAEKDGLRAVFYPGHVSESYYIQQMDRISLHWLEQKGGTEMGFSMGHFEPQGDPEQLYVLAVDAQEHVHGFVSFIPIYGRHGWGLDLMRRAEQCAPGTMEFLLARTMEYMKQANMQMASLGLAPLSNANSENGRFLETSIDFLTRHFGDPKKNLSLFNFKKKFQPAWESRYLVYADALSLPKIGLALYNVHRADSSLLREIRDSLQTWRRNRREAGNTALAERVG